MVSQNFTIHKSIAPRDGSVLCPAKPAEVTKAAQPEGVHLKLAGRIDESNVKARIVAAGFAAPVYTFTVDVDRLDLDRYLPAAATRTSVQAAPERGENLLAPLAGLPASGTLTVGLLHAGGTKASNVKVVLK